MRKILSKIAGLALGLSLTAGVGLVASGKKTEHVHGATSLAATFECGADGSASHADGSSASTYSETDDSYTLSISNGYKFYTAARDAKGNGCFKFGTSSAVGSMSFTAPSDVILVKIYVGGYKDKTAKISINSGSTQTISTLSNNGEYTAVEVDTSSTKTVSFTTASGGVRAMINTIEYYIDGGTPTCTHNWVAGTVHAPTCTEAGYTEYECSLCGDTKQDDVTAALGHDYGAWTVVTPATCLTAGEERRVCSHDSSHVETRVVAALGHSYVNHICERCGAEEPNEVIASTQVSAYAEAHSWANQTQYLTMNLNSVVTATVTGTTNSGKYYTNDSSWRLYSSESAKLTFSTANDETLISATLTFLSTDSPTIQYGGVNVTSGSAVVLSGSSAEFSVTAGKAHLTALSVTYAGESETIYTITYLANAEDAEGTMSPTAASSPQVATCSFTRDGYEFARWNTQADGEGDNYTVGTSVSEDLTLYAIWQEYVAPIEGNVSMEGVTSASAVTVNGHPALKCGAGSTAGAMKLVLNNAGISKIKVYVAGWKGDTSKTINIETTGCTMTENSISVTEDSAITGSFSDVTLNGAETTYRFIFDISDATAGAEITLTAAQANKNRFIVWGASDLFAESFASEFNSNLTCDATGEDGPSFTSGHDWTTMNSFYNGLDAEEQGRLHDATFTVSGSGSSTVVTATGDTVQSVAEAMARYDYILAKYGTSEYTNFVGRSVTKLAPARMVDGTISSSSSTIIIVVVALTSITSIGVLLVIKRRRSLVK